MEGVWKKKTHVEQLHLFWSSYAGAVGIAVAINMRLNTIIIIFCSSAFNLCDVVTRQRYYRVLHCTSTDRHTLTHAHSFPFRLHRQSYAFVLERIVSNIHYIPSYSIDTEHLRRDWTLIIFIFWYVGLCL